MADERARPIRIGILGTATVAGYALLAPARLRSDVVVTMVGSRDRQRAGAFAAANGIARSGTYEDVVGNPEIDAIYIALPNSLHAEWIARALSARKAILCEKPLAANAQEARAADIAARAAGVALVEAFHWRLHPVAGRIQKVLASREIGALRRIEVRFGYPRASLQPNDIRLDYGLGGGVLMDAGCYAVNLMRLLAGEPTGCADAQASLASPEVDVELTATLRFAGGIEGHLSLTNQLPGDEFDIYARLIGEDGTATVHNPFLPSFGCRIDFAKDGREWTEQLGDKPSYDYQLAHFVDVVRGDAEPCTNAGDAALNQAAIDMIYRSAGLSPRGL